MRKETIFTIVLLLSFLALPASAEITFGPGTEGILYSGDGVAPLDALFGSALAISPGEHLQESVLVCLEDGGRLYLQCQNLPQSLAGLHLSVQGEAPIFDGTLGSTSWIYLGNFPSGTREQLHFVLTVPRNLSHQGQLDWQKVRWKILTELPKTPATGDRFRPGPAMAVLLLSGMGLAIVFKKRKVFE